MSNGNSRRHFFRTAAAVGVFSGARAAPPAGAASYVGGSSNLTVKKVDRTWINVPFRDAPARNMIRELPHWTIFEICRVTLASGVVGFGETMVYYTWGRVSDEAVQRVTGRNAAEQMWDDSLGCGLQMALFDAVAKANDVPVYRLLGPKRRDRPFISWWAIDMPAEDWLLECKDALAQGYTDFKTKARPWFDLDRQCSAFSKDLPRHFKIDFDFNSMLLDSSRAGRYLVQIEKYPNVAIYESPIPQSDVAGNKMLRSQTRVPIAMHYGSPPIMTALREDVCDAFVIGGGASGVMNDGTVAAAADKPFWLQLVGTGITAAFALHFGAALSHARWPSVNCHQLFTHPMIRPELRVENGTAAVPEAPGLGVTLDEDAVERLRIQPLSREPYPAPNLLIAIRWPSGATSYYAHARQYWDDFLGGRLPLFPEGVYLERIADNGSREWKELQARAAQSPVHTGGRPL
ncbi:MAG: mandelate racemase/muconate lactonizing enzyme family protein [Bryobacteraceae bacterium]|nr:mandelate racemase/muconate lactonizing enzyme family protein [Bryobacteraceae bacterium]